MIHLSRGAAAAVEGIVATRRIRDRGARIRREQEEATADAIAGFEFVRRVYQHALAGAHLVRRELFLPFVLASFQRHRRCER